MTGRRCREKVSSVRTANAYEFPGKNTLSPRHSSFLLSAPNFICCSRVGPVEGAATTTAVRVAKVLLSATRLHSSLAHLLLFLLPLTQPSLPPPPSSLTFSLSEKEMTRSALRPKWTVVCGWMTRREGCGVGKPDEGRGIQPTD